MRITTNENEKSRWTLYQWITIQVQGDNYQLIFQVIISEFTATKLIIFSLYVSLRRQSLRKYIKIIGCNICLDIAIVSTFP